LYQFVIATHTVTVAHQFQSRATKDQHGRILGSKTMTIMIV
jgi:hypothetical protein